MPVKLAGLLRGVLADFGPLLAFWMLELTAGLKPAIAGAMTVIVADSLWRWWYGRRFTRLYLLTSSLTVVFGAVDVLSATPFMLKYEAVITNILVGAAFVAGAGGKKPMVQEFAEQRPGAAPFPDRPDITSYFRLVTLVWACYFFLKALFNLVVGEMLPLVQAMALRSAVGVVSLGLLMVISITQGRRLFFLCQRLGWLAPPG